MSEELNASEDTGTTPETVGEDGANSNTQDPYSDASRGMKDRLDRLATKLRREEVQPLQRRVQELEAQLASLQGSSEGQGQSQSDASDTKTEEVADEPAAHGEPAAPPPRGTQPAPEHSVEALRLRVLLRNGLAESDETFITGTTVEEIEASVRAFKERLEGYKAPPRRSPVPPASDTPVQPTYKASDYKTKGYDWWKQHKADIEKAKREGRFDYQS